MILVVIDALAYFLQSSDIDWWSVDWKPIVAYDPVTKRVNDVNWLTDI